MKRGGRNRITINQFWFSAEGSDVLPAYAVLSLWSFARFPKHRVVLWTYQTFQNVPQNVEVKRASALIPKKTALQWANGGILAEHLSDVIRLKALQKTNGWWVDADTIALQSFATYHHPYMFQTLPAKRTGLTRIRNFDFPTLVDKKMDTWDGKDMFGNGVLKAPSKSEFLRVFLERGLANIENMLTHIQKTQTSIGRDNKKRKGKMEWNLMVKTGRDLVKTLGLQQYVMQPRMFHPWHSLTPHLFAQRVKHPDKSSYSWYGYPEDGLSDLLRDPAVYALSLSGSHKKGYNSKTLDEMKRLVIAL